MVNDKTIENHFCVCAISLEINYWNAHCFTPVVFSVQTGVVLHKRIVVSADSKVYGRRKKWGSTFYVGTKKGSLIDLFSLNIWGKRGVSKFYIFPAHWNRTKMGVVKNRGAHWNQKVVILTTFSSLTAPEVVIRTTSGATSDEKVVNMTTFLFSVGLLT